MMSANRLAASVWMEGRLVVSTVRGRQRERDKEKETLVLQFYFVIYYHFLYWFILICSFFYLLPLSLCPSLLLHFSVRCTQLYKWYIYSAVALGYEFPLIMFCI
jgi:hypothetical protein